jgi:hypothetical protein
MTFALASNHGKSSPLSDGGTRWSDRVSLCDAHRGTGAYRLGVGSSIRWISANLSNQFEWPMLFYVACLAFPLRHEYPGPQLWLAWAFVAGRIAHSGVQVFTSNIRLRGMVFTINFIAVLGMWFWPLVVLDIPGVGN